MNHRFLYHALVLLALALSLTACGSTSQGSSGKLGTPKTQAPTSDTVQQPDVPSTTVPEEPYVYSIPAQASIEDLYTNRYGELFAAAYLGYREAGDTSNFTVWLYNNYPMIPSFWPFVVEIPEEDTIGEYGDLYCVVPLEESVSFTVKGVEWELLGNGTMPHYSEPLYYAEVNRPFLMYVTHGQWRDETNLTLEYVQQDGFVGTWFPTYSTDTGRIETWENPESCDTILDFALQYGIGYNTDIPVGDMAWLPPTDLGLGGTTWHSENGWELILAYDETAEGYSGGMVLYEPLPNGDDVFLTRYCHGVWWMEGDSLYLDAYNDWGEMVGGAFPVRVSPSGEQLIVIQAEDGTVLPFFEDGNTRTTLTLSYG